MTIESSQAEQIALEQELDWQQLDLYGKSLIEASAGTGKTFTLVLLVIRLLLERELPLPSILLSTYTEAATAELRARVTMRIDQAYCAALPSRDTAHRSIDPSDPLYAYLEKRWHHASLGKPKPGRGALSVRDRDARLLRAALSQTGEMAVKTLHSFCRFILAGVSGEGMNAQSEQGLVDAELLNEQAIDDAIRRRFVNVSELNLLQADCLDREFLNDLRRALKRILMYGRLPMRAVQSPDLYTYCTARSALFTPEFANALRDDLANAQLALRATVERAAQRLLITLKAAPARALPRGLLRLFSAHDSHIVLARQRKPLGSFPGLTRLREFARLSEQQRRAQFAQMLLELAGELRLARRQQLQMRGAMTFDSMIENLALRLDPQSGQGASQDDFQPIRADAARELAASIRARFPVALIDEFQDTDEQQWAILRAIYGAQGGLILVGDPKQAIYRFRGSDVHTFIRAKKQCACYFLNQNFRARPALLAALTYFYQRASDAFFSPDVRFRAPSAGRVPDSGESIALQFFQSEPGKTIVDACHHLARRYQAALSTGSVPSMAMLLARRNDVQFAQQLLMDLGVSARSGVAEQIIDSPLAACCRVVLPALIDIGNVAAARSAWVRMGKVSWFDAQKSDSLQLLDWASARLKRWQRDGIAALVLDLAAEIDPNALAGIAPYELPSWESDAKALAEYLAETWREVAPAPAVRASLALFQRGANALLKCLQPQPIPAGSRPNSERRASTPSVVQLLTVHAAKGLEFDEVHLPSLHFSHAPDQHVAIVAGPKGLECDVGSVLFAEAIAEEATESLRERLRLQYVALTRARAQLYVYFEFSKRFGQENSLIWHLRQAAPAVDVMEDFAEQLERSDELSEDWRLGLQEIGRHPAIQYGEFELAEPLHASGQLTPATALARPLVISAVNLARPPRSRLSFTSLTRTQSESPAPFSLSEQIAELLDQTPSISTEEVNSHPEIVALAAHKGPGFGQALHELFELALTRGEVPTRAELEVCLARAMMQPRLQSDDEITAVDALLRRVLHSPMRPAQEFEAPPLRLVELAPQHCLVELGFYMPVHALELSRLAELGVPAGLGRLFFPEAEHGFANVEGALVGFIDLIYQHAGRFYVLDYKSNFLGNCAQDYRDEALSEAMAGHFYHLQHLIYALALHRYLRSSLPGYSYAKHFGGVHYLFFRAFGLSGQRSGEYLGDYYYRAPEQLITELDQLFGAHGS